MGNKNQLLLSSSENLILDSEGMKRHIVRGGTTAHAAPTVFCPFQTHYHKTRSMSTVQFLIINGAKWSVKNILTEINNKKHKKVTAT